MGTADPVSSHVAELSNHAEADGERVEGLWAARPGLTFLGVKRYVLSTRSSISERFINLFVGKFYSPP